MPPAKYSEQIGPAIKDECKYQVQTDFKTYICFTESEYQKYKQEPHVMSPMEIIMIATTAVAVIVGILFILITISED